MVRNLTFCIAPILSLLLLVALTLPLSFLVALLRFFLGRFLRLSFKISFGKLHENITPIKLYFVLQSTILNFWNQFFIGKWKRTFYSVKHLIIQIISKWAFFKMAFILKWASGKNCLRYILTAYLNFKSKISNTFFPSLRPRRRVLNETRAIKMRMQQMKENITDIKTATGIKRSCMYKNVSKLTSSSRRKRYLHTMKPDCPFSGQYLTTWTKKQTEGWNQIKSTIKFIHTWQKVQIHWDKYLFWFWPCKYHRIVYPPREHISNVWQTYNFSPEIRSQQTKYYIGKKYF